MGVASGDPVADGVVLWTRLAPDPDAENGLGGMPEDKVVPVEWQIATDEQFTQIVQDGTVDAVSASAHSVHIEAEGLDAGTEYFYRFRAEGNYSPVGRTRTAPAPGTMGELTMCFASCAHWEHGFFAAYRRMAEDQPGLILHLGDYQYEYEKNHGEPPEGGGFVRDHPDKETTSLALYRQRHGLYKTDLDLQAAHAVAPWVVVFDDHEVENNWAGDVPEDGSQTPGDDFLPRRKAAFQAYYENMPLRSAAKPSGSDMQLYRRFSWGGLATFHMLDTRQYRDDQCEDSSCDPDDPDRTITGSQQEQWLLDGFNNSSARWDVLGQQVFFARRDNKPGDGEELNMDAWDGYTASRDRIASAMSNSKVRNGVVLTGDVHRHWAAEVKEDHSNPDSKNVGVELVTTSITSTGDGDPDATNKDVLEENPHIKYYKNLRGYVRTTFTETELRADFRTLDKVSVEDGAASTDATFLVSDGDPTLKPA
ncbi:MAG: alkaline phosphatase [Pseudonocardiaceae bacterium]|nr:alkaline phosphatase [Pseudonocardiaceae bacterium]